MKAPKLETVTVDYLKSFGVEPHYMGLGVVKLPITPMNSFHFYCDQTEQICDDPHTHRFGFTSTLVKGSMENLVYEARASDKETPYVLEYGQCEPNANMEIIQRNIEPLITGRFITTQGSSYTLDSKCIHRIICLTDKVVTFLEKNPDDILKAGRRLRDPGENWFIVNDQERFPCAFSQPKTPERCWEIIEYTLAD